MSETCACKINHDSYHTALNHIFIRLLQSWMSHSARRSLRGGRAAPHDIGWTPSLELFSLLLSPVSSIGYFRCCSLLDRAANLLNEFCFGKTLSLIVFLHIVWCHKEITAHRHWFLDFSFEWLLKLSKSFVFHHLTSLYFNTWKLWAVQKLLEDLTMRRVTNWAMLQIKTWLLRIAAIELGGDKISATLYEISANFRTS